MAIMLSWRMNWVHEVPQIGHEPPQHMATMKRWFKFDRALNSYTPLFIVVSLLFVINTHMAVLERQASKMALQQVATLKGEKG